MALSATRVAAFEFLIQFRSVGRQQIRNGVRQLASLRRASRNLRASNADLSASQLAFANALRVSQRNLLASIAAQNAYNAARNSEIAINRRLAASRLAADRQQRFNRAAQNPVVRGIANRFGLRNGARAAQSLSSIKGGAQRASMALRGVSKILGPIAVGFQVVIGAARTFLSVLAQAVKINAIVIGSMALLTAGLAKVADNFTLLSNRIRVASDGNSTVSETMAELLQIANRARAPVNDISELYGRIAINAKQFGISQEEILRVVEITGKTFRIGGSNAREASQAALQFAQALGSNRLSGDELRAVREQATELSQTLARGLGVGVGKLKELGETGALTTKVVIDALLSQEKIVNARFGRVEATFADGITNLRSSVGFLFGSIGSAIGLGPKFFAFSDKIAQGFNKISERSGEFAVALSRLPRLFRILGLNGLSRFFDMLRRIGDFLTTLPDKVLDLGSSINQFVNEFESSGSIESAAQRAFGISSDALRGNSFITGVNNFLEFFTKQLPVVADAVIGTAKAMVQLSEAVRGLAAFINGTFALGNAALRNSPIGPAVNTFSAVSAIRGRN